VTLVDAADAVVARPYANGLFHSPTVENPNLTVTIIPEPANGSGIILCQSIKNDVARSVIRTPRYVVEKRRSI